MSPSDELEGIRQEAALFHISGSFAKQLRKKSSSFIRSLSVCLSTCLSGRQHGKIPVPLNIFWWNFILGILLKCLHEWLVSWNLD